MFRDTEPRREKVDLMGSQKEAVRDLLSVLQIPDLEKTLFVLEGLSGVGKTAVLHSVEPQLSALAVKALEGHPSESWDELNNRIGHAVATVTPGELSQIKTKQSLRGSNFGVVPIRVKGMTGPESVKYVSSIPRYHGNDLSVMFIARYSLGVPLLAQRLCLPGVTKEIARTIAATYLSDQVDRMLNTEILSQRITEYLVLPVPDDVQKQAIQLSWKRKENTLYSSLSGVLGRFQQLVEEGVDETSPVFVAAESEGIYDKMLESNNRPDIDIFVPNIHRDDLGRIQESFGYDGRRYSRHRRRITMFLADFRKVSIWHKDQYGDEVFDIDSRERYRDQVRLYTRGYHRGELGIHHHETPGGGSFMIHAHDHERAINPTLIGWLTESMLQSLGIAYHVTNHTLGMSYVYNPQSRRIKTLPEKFEYQQMD